MNKEEQIQALLNSPVVKGDDVQVIGLNSHNKNMWVHATVAEVYTDGAIGVKKDGSNNVVIVEKGNYRKSTYRIGADPFPKQYNDIRSLAFDLQSVVFGLGLTAEKSEYDEQGIPIMNCNWNPFVYAQDGTKKYYQRDFVWTDDDKRLLIDSIYYGVDCGKILIRKRSWETLTKMHNTRGERELSFKDVVDGKQRLNAVMAFRNNEFADSFGNYYKDLSDNAQKKVFGHQLFSYAELPEETTDEEVIEQFLKLNFTGVPQSKEHLDHVKEIQRKF